jgi:hypothetical protein
LADDSGHVNLRYLREVLSRGNPPDEAVRPYLGTTGPIIGTIHGSKGREAEDVVLSLTDLRADADHEEESRVLYVGATRAKSRLRVLSSTSRHGYLTSRRAWKHTNRQRCVQAEFGLDGDVDLVSPVDRNLMTDRHARELQDLFATVRPSELLVEWRSERDLNWRRVIAATDSGWRLGACSSRFDADLWELASKSGDDLRPSDSQRYLYVVDYTTVARDEDSPDINRINNTFAESGFWVTPLIKGYSFVCSKWGGGRSRDH